jgi:hypothetical protein
MAEGLDIGTLTGRIELEDRLTNVLEQVGGALGKFEGGFKSIGGTILETATGFLSAEVAIRAVEGAIHLGIDALKEMTIEGAAVADVEENFNHLTETAGRLGSTLLNELQEGTHNTISNFELMKLANADLAAGLNLSDQQFRTMADGAFALAQATGVDVKQALESMNEALLKGQARGVQSLTGRIDMIKAEEDYAAKLHTTADRLTTEEKLQSAREAILNAVSQATGRLGEQTDGLDEKIAQAQTTWANFTEELGKTIATSPVIIAGFDGVRDALIEAFGGSQESLVKTIAGAIDSAAITAFDFAQVVVDGVGIAGVEWNAFKVVVETSAQGFRAITYVVEEVLLGLMEVANFVSGGSLFGGAIEATKADIERLYNAMAEGENRIDGYKKAQDEWAVSTGHVNEALEKIKTRMVEAKANQEANTQATNEGADANLKNAASAGESASQQGVLAAATRMTAEEAKKYKEAWESILNVGASFKDTINQVSGEIVEAVKYYLDAGVSLEKLKVAYQLTDEQAQAIAKSWKEHNDLLDENKKKVEDTAEAWKHLNDLGKDQDQILRGVGDRVRDDVGHFKDLGASTKELALAFGLTETQINAIIATRDRDTAALGAERAATQQLTTAQMDAAQVVRTLSGEYITLAEAKARASQGGSMNVNAANFGSVVQSFGLDLTAATELAKKGYSFQGIVEMLRAGTLSLQQIRALPNGPGPRIPGFRGGGVGDFGEGTLAMLHGKEAIVPLDNAQGGLGGMTLNFYVNGTAVQAAQQIKEIIMRELKSQRQFGAA